MNVEEKKIQDQPFVGPLIDQAIENHTRMQSLLWKTNPIIIPVLNYRRLWAFQVVPVIKNLPANAGDIRHAVRSLGWEDALEEGTATHSSILAWRIPMGREAWRATVHSITESDMTQMTRHLCTISRVKQGYRFFLTYNGVPDKSTIS